MKAYQIITDRIIAALESGTAPWRRTWKAGAASAPRSLATGKPYRGINYFMLAMEQGMRGYADPRWATFNQIKQRGGCVRKGERGTPIVFWTFLESQTEVGPDGKPKRIPFLRYYTVFNVVAQADGLDLAPFGQPEEGGCDFSPIEACEAIVARHPDLDLRHGGGQAYYAPGTDHVQMPEREAFVSPEAYYATLFHEMAHWTGHASRLARPGIADKVAAFGSETYGKEELVAEMTAAFLAAETGIDREEIFDNSAAYLAGWLKAIKEDSKLVVAAAGAAQKAATFILAEEAEEAEAEEDAA